MAVAVVDVQVRSSGAVNSLRQINTASKEAQGALEGLKRAAAGLALVQVGRQAVQAAASFNDLQLRLKLLTAQYGETAKVQQFAAESARRFGLSNREAAEGVTNIYARLRPLGVSLKDIQSTFTGFNTVAKLSGVGSIEAAQGFRQLAQALGSGRLQGDEFVRIAESVPGILVAVSKETGIAAGDLKKYASEGKLTAEIVVAALRRIETEGAGKIAQIIQQGDVQRFKDFQNAVDDLQIALGNELLPLVAPLVKDLTSLVRAITGLPEPVKNTTIELVRLGVQVLLVKKALEAIIAIRVALVGSLAASGAAAATSASAFSLYANNAKTLAAQSAAASGKVNPLVASLQSLAALGVITVAINLAVSGLQEFIQARNEINRLRGQREKGGAAAVFAGAAPAGSKQTAQKTLQQIRTEQRTLQSPLEIAKSFLGPLAPLVGGMTPAARGERGILLKERAAFAQGVLGLPTRVEQPSTTPPPDAPSGTGIDPLAKQKMGKKEKDILEITKQERDLRLQLNVAQLQQNKEQEAFYTRQLALLDISQKKIGVNQRESEIFAVMVQYNQTMKQIQEEQANNTLPKMVEKLSEAASGYSKNLDLATELTEQQKQQKELADGIAGTIGGGMASAFDALIQGSQDFGASLRQIASGVLIDIANQLLRIFVINQAINAISGLLGPKTGGFLPNVKFNPVAFSGINLRAMGGSVTAGQGYLVGERGPELFMPGRSGGIAPAGGFGGGANIVVNVDANGTSAGGDSSKAGQLGKVVAAAVQAELVKQRRPGGILA